MESCASAQASIAPTFPKDLSQRSGLLWWKYCWLPAALDLSESRGALPGGRTHIESSSVFSFDIWSCVVGRRFHVSHEVILKLVDLCESKMVNWSEKNLMPQITVNACKKTGRGVHSFGFVGCSTKHLTRPQKELM